MAVYTFNWASIANTFLASIRSVGTAVTLASIGVYLHRRGFVTSAGKRTLALVSQQVTFPLFLFTKIIYCNQDWSSNPCPDVTKSLKDVWILLFWPLYVVSAGILVGWMVTKLCRTPTHQVRAVIAACAFGNSTGLPITLLTVVHANFPATSDLGRIDPTLFLSVYLLLYPVLQWGIGGWLLAPDDDEEPTHYRSKSISESFSINVLNHTSEIKQNGLSSTDEGLYVSEKDLMGLAKKYEGRDEAIQVRNESMTHLNSYYEDDEEEEEEKTKDEEHPLLKEPPKVYDDTLSNRSVAPPPELKETLKKILKRCFQPPVIGGLMGIFFAVTPLRGLFVDLVDRSSSAPFQWIFDGLYAVGVAAVPINMMILGCNISASWQTIVNPPQSKGDGKNETLFPMSTMIGIVVGKMIVLPLIGITSSRLLRSNVLDVASDIEAAFYLVVMIVFLTPTANNVMVMVELSGYGAKEGLATVIALQYAVAPIILSLTMSIVIGFASSWS